MLVGFKNPFIKSLLNLNVDYSGKFFSGLKRYKAARKILANLNLLNRVKPQELSDFMIQRRQAPKSKTGRLLILCRAFGLSTGAKQGNSKAFSKRLHTQLIKVTRHRQDFIIRIFVCRLDLFLYNLHLFESIPEARSYITTFGVFVNDIMIYNARRVLKALDVISLLPEHRCFFKARFYYFFSGSLLFAPHYERSSRFFFNLLHYKQNLFNFSFNTPGFGAKVPYKELAGAGQLTISTVNPLSMLNSLSCLLGSPSYPKKLVAFALAFKRRKWAPRWRDLQLGHPDNLKRVVAHSLSVNPYALDFLVTKLTKRLRRFYSREFWYFFPWVKSKITISSITHLNLKETVLLRSNRYRYFRRFRKMGHFNRRYSHYRSQRFRDSWPNNKDYHRKGTEQIQPVQRLESARYRLKEQTKGVVGCFTRVVFEKDFCKSFIRILFWRFRKLRHFALLARLQSHLVGFNKTSHCFNRFLLSTNVMFGARVAKFFSFSSVCSLNRTQSVVPEGFIAFNGPYGLFTFPYFLDGLLRYVINNRLSTSSGFAPSKNFSHKKALVRFVFRKPGVPRPRLRKKFGYRLICLPKEFMGASKFYPKTLIHSLTRVPWYVRLPFSRSNFSRFYRLHPRYSSVFFPNFLPRFVEPSLKSFEFLIRPLLLKPFDLRLPFKVRRGARLSLLMSLV